MKHLFFLYLTLVNTIFLLLGLEAAGQIAYRIVRGHWVAQAFPAGQQGEHGAGPRPPQIFEVHPYLVGRLRPGHTTTWDSVTVTATAGSTRWTGAPTTADARSVVAVVGGSTTFGTGVSDADAWPSLLQARLGPEFAVINYGVPGYSTAEALIQMGLIVPEARPDVIVFYQGWNDIRNYHDPEIGTDYYSHGLQQFGNLMLGVSRLDTRGLVHKAGDYSAIFRLVISLSGRLVPATGEAPPSLSSAPDTLVDRVYVRNLRTLNALADHVGAYALFVPQILNERRLLNNEGAHYWSPRIKADQLPRLMERFNGFMDDACGPEETGCSVVHAVAAEEWRRPDFIDSGHFSREGGERFVAILAEHILAATESM